MLEDKFDGKNPFSVPDAYMDSFSDRMMKRIEQEEVPEKTSAKNVFKTYFWLAATFVLIFGIGRLIIPLVLDPSEKIQMKTSEPIISAKNEVDTSSEYIDLTDDEIIDYLADQDIDSSNLIAEFN